MIIDRLLIALFSNDITIDLAPDGITFTTNGRSISLVPVLYVQHVTDRPRVFSVGEELGGVPSDVTRVDLFTTSPSPSGVDDRFEMLEAFFRFGVQKLMNRTVLVRPAIVIRGIRSLSRLLNGYERGLVTRAVEGAGARSVVFAEI